jgi:mannosidase alpha-like ER degradation enhancer 3
VQLIHNSANAASNEDANDGLIFIQEMMDLMKNTNEISSSQTNRHLPLTVIPLLTSPLTKLIHLTVGPAQFGKQLHGRQGVNSLSE